MPAISSTNSRCVMRRIVNAYFAPSGSPWKIDDSGNRISVAANEPPKITMAA
ncbi:hypothetical protein D3C83_221860 [compost metagenome]